MLPQTAQGKERCGELPTQAATAEILKSLNPAHSMAQTVYKRIPKNDLSVGKASLSPDTAVKPTLLREWHGAKPSLISGLTPTACS